MRFFLEINYTSNKLRLLLIDKELGTLTILNREVCAEGRT